MPIYHLSGTKKPSPGWGRWLFAVALYIGGVKKRKRVKRLFDWLELIIVLTCEKNMKKFYLIFAVSSAAAGILLSGTVILFLDDIHRGGSAGFDQLGSVDPQLQVGIVIERKDAGIEHVQQIYDGAVGGEGGDF